MTDDNDKVLGRLLSVHGIAPAYMQRAVFIIVLSFLFFLAMMLAYYIRQSLVYFLLASAFLLLYVITMFSWFLQRRNIVKVHARGLSCSGRTVLWSDIDKMSSDGTIYVVDGKPFSVPASISDRPRILEVVRRAIRG